MKKFLFLFLAFTICACENTKTYTVGEDAICSGLEESDENSVFCVDKNGTPVNGVVKQYYDNGGIWREMNIKNGLENGIEREYYRNGKIHVVANVVNGKTDGLSKLYNEDGNLYMEMNWKNGEMMNVKVYDDKGNIIQTNQDL